MLNITDQELKDLSLTTLQLPLVIDDPIDGGLVQGKAAIVLEKDRLQTLDTQNKIFTDHWITVLSKYYSELEALNKVVNTLYDEATLVLGGQSLSPHYLDNSWIPLVPIVVGSSVGNPTSVGANPDEDELIIIAEAARTDLVSGFGGVVDSTLASAHTIGSGVFESLDTFAVGSRVILDNGTDSLLAVVTDDVNAPIYDINVLSTDKTIASGARVRDFHIGFNDSERGHQTTNYAFDVQVYFESVLNASIVSWKSNLNIQKTALETNNDLLSSNQILNTSAFSAVSDSVSDLSSWESSTVIDINGKYTDATLPLITDHITARPALIASRVADIGTNLGPLVQAGDGSVTGVGVYASLYEFVNIRIGKAGGTLYGFYSLDMSVGFYNVKIATATAQLSQYDNTFAIASIITDTIVGSIEFEVDSVDDFSVGQVVKIMDNDSIVFTRTIDTIVGNIITMDSGITAALLVASIARIVRQK